MAMCIGPPVAGAVPCGRELPPRLPGQRGRRRVRCDFCGSYEAKRLAKEKLERERIEQARIEPIQQTVLPVPLVDVDAPLVAHIQTRHCTWMDHEGHLCDALLENVDEFFCVHHGMPPRSQYVPHTPFSGSGVLMPSSEPEPYVRGGLEGSHYESLTRLGLESTPDGMLVLTLARRLDRGVSDSATATIAAQLRACAKEVYAGAPPLPGAMDDLRRRREEKMRVATEQTENASDA